MTAGRHYRSRNTRPSTLTRLLARFRRPAPVPADVPAADEPDTGRHHPHTVTKADATHNPLDGWVRQRIAPNTNPWVKAGVDEHTGRLDATALLGDDPDIDLSLDCGPTLPITDEQRRQVLAAAPEYRRRHHHQPRTRRHRCDPIECWCDPVDQPHPNTDTRRDER